MSKEDLKSVNSKKRALIIDSVEEDAELRKKAQSKGEVELGLKELATINDSLDEVTSTDKAY